jgi:preprotein translocase subunit YajC
MSPDILQWVILGGLVLVFYMFFIRPQQKKAKEAQQFLDNLKPGDKIVTAGGIHGKLLKIDEKIFVIQVDNNTKLRIEKSGISADMTQEAVKSE